MTTPRDRADVLTDLLDRMDKRIRDARQFCECGLYEPCPDCT